MRVDNAETQHHTLTDRGKPFASPAAAEKTFDAMMGELGVSTDLKLPKSFQIKTIIPHEKIIRLVNSIIKTKK